MLDATSLGQLACLSLDSEEASQSWRFVFVSIATFSVIMDSMGVVAAFADAVVVSAIGDAAWDDTVGGKYYLSAKEAQGAILFLDDITFWTPTLLSFRILSCTKEGLTDGEAG
jgi:hypothetical protein